MKKIISSSGFLLAVIAIFLMARCNEKSQAASSETSAQEEAIPVKTQPVSSGNYQASLEYPGSVASTSEAKLSFKIGGVISRIYVKEGEAVTRGQLLATLDLTEINAQVQQAVQGAEKARRDAGRIKNLYQDTVASLEQLQNATTQQQLSEEALRIARFNQQYAQIRATENGTILKKLMNEGELASSGSPVFYFSGNDQHQWVIRFGVSDKDWARLKKGDAAAIRIDAYPDRLFNGVISEIASGADMTGGTYEVEVKIIPGNAKLASGLYGTVQLHPSSNMPVQIVPIEALTEGEGKKAYVYTLNTDRQHVTRHPVTIAYMEKDRAAISQGLDGIDEVITDGAGYLTDKSTVKLIQSPGKK